MARGLYGSLEGNERRGSSLTFGDRLVENDLVEGDHVATLRRMVTNQNWVAVTSYTDRLKREGHVQSRVDSMVSRAMAGLRF